MRRVAKVEGYLWDTPGVPLAYPWGTPGVPLGQKLKATFTADVYKNGYSSPPEAVQERAFHRRGVSKMRFLSVALHKEQKKTNGSHAAWEPAQSRALLRSSSRRRENAFCNFASFSADVVAKVEGHFYRRRRHKWLL